MVQTCAPVRPFEQRTGRTFPVFSGNRRNAAQEFEAAAVEPPEHFSDGVLRFMRVAVLVVEPSPLLFRAGPPRTELRVDPLAASTRELENTSPEVGHEPTVGVVEADDDHAARTNQSLDPFEPPVRIGRMVEHAVAQDDVETLGFEAGHE